MENMNKIACCQNCGELKDANTEIIWVNRLSTTGLCKKCYPNLITDKICPKCGAILFKEKGMGYMHIALDSYYICYECDNRFTQFEIEI